MRLDGKGKGTSEMLAISNILCKLFSLVISLDCIRSHAANSLHSYPTGFTDLSDICWHLS